MKLGEHGGEYEVIATDQPCWLCGEEIQPGQLYTWTQQGPQHLGHKLPYAERVNITITKVPCE